MEQKLVFRVSAEFQELKNAFNGIKEDFTTIGDEVKKIEDKFTKSWTKMEANTKIFGETAENVKGKMVALKTSMVDLVSKGIDPADARIVKMKSDYDALSNSMNNTEGLRKSNQAWTNLALVVQDLPYGFRGIQNNLPALFGSIAAAAGPAYLAFSALVALFTAYGTQITDAIFKTSALEKAQREMSTGVIEAAKSTTSAREEILKVTSVVKAAKDGFVDKTAALQYYNDKLGDSFGKVASLDAAEQALVDKAPKYIEALAMKAKAEYYFAKASEYAVKKDIAGLEDQTSALDKLKVLSQTVAKFADFSGPKQIIGTFINALGSAQKAGVEKAQQTAGAISDVLTVEGKKAMTNYFKMLKEGGLTDEDIASIIEKINKAQEKANAKAAKLGEKAIEQRKKDIAEIDKAETEGFLATLSNQEKEEYLVNQKFVRLEEMAIKYGLSTKDLETARLDELAKIRKTYADKEEEEARKKNEKLQAESKRVADRDLQNQLDAINIAAETKAKLAKRGPSATKAAYQAEIDALYELASTGGYTADQFDKIDDAIIRVKAKMESLDISTLKGAEALQKVNNIIQDMVTNTFVLFGESLGKIFAGQNVDIFGGFVELMGNGLEEIGKALVSYGLAMEAFKNAFTNPFAAVAAGLALIVAGSYLKQSIAKTGGNTEGSVQTFANGGIISGPTLGLMGEYPGASSNPEVVAPLDKLKDIMGNGNQGGTFVLRGQDLLLAVNRSQKASSLKGQSISLA